MNRRRLLEGVGAVGAALTAAASCAQAASVPDAKLLQLGQRFEAAWKVETAAWDASEGLDDAHPLTVRAMRLNMATRALVRKMEGIPATTLPGLLVKCRAVRWCCGDDEPGDYIFENVVRHTREEFTTDVRLSASILADLHVMVGGAA